MANETTAAVGRLTAGVLLLVTSLSAASAEPRAVVADEAADEVMTRLYELGANGDIVWRRLPEAPETAPPMVPVRPVGKQEIKAELDLAGAARAAALTDVARAPLASRLVPEDLTRRASVLHMAVVNYTDAAFVEHVARVSRREGFSVVAHLVADSEWAEPLSRVPGLVTTRLPPRLEYIWTEDVTEIAVDGTFQITARMGDRGLLRRTLFVDRIRRYYPEVTPAELEEINRLPAVPDRPPGELPEQVMRRFSDIMFMIQGLVERDGGHAVAAAMAISRGAKLREALTYLEGGNVLIGTLPSGEPYALVGRDSAAVSRALLERHHRSPVSEAEVIAVMAKDLGVEPARLFLVEQPGVFHLDMAMTLLAPGTVIMNDALEAFRLQTRWLREDHAAWRPRRLAAASEQQYRHNLDLWRQAGRGLEETIQKLWKYTERFARYETLTLKDLLAAGLTVRRMAGRFPHPTRPWDRDLMNFFNGEAGTSPRGGTYFMTQGGDPRAERYAASRLLAPATGLERLYLAPRLASRDTLWEKGATSCRVKAEGEIVTLAPGRR